MCDADKSANNEPYVIKLIEVIRNSMAPYTKPFTVTGRHSDAYVYILTGTCFYEFENDSFSVKAGDILYLANDSTYRMSVGGEEYSFLYCDFKFADGGKGLLFHEPVLHVPGKVQAVVRVIRLLLHGEGESPACEG